MLKKKKGLKAQLRNCIESISIDVFGYEQLVSQHIVRYLESLDLEPVNRINVRIGCREGRPEARLFYRDECLRTVSTAELVTFFTGQSGEQAQRTSVSVINSIRQYLRSKAEQRKVSPDALTIRVWQPLNKVHVSLYVEDQYREDLLLKTLIKHFMS